MEKAGPPEPSKISRALTPTLDATAPPGAVQSPYVPPAATDGEPVPPFGAWRAFKHIAGPTGSLLAFLWLSTLGPEWKHARMAFAGIFIVSLMTALREYRGWPRLWRTVLAKEAEKKNRKRKQKQR
jgi:hypothetical protein